MFVLLGLYIILNSMLGIIGGFRRNEGMDDPSGKASRPGMRLLYTVRTTQCCSL